MCFPLLFPPTSPSHLTPYTPPTLLHLSIHPTSSVLQILNIHYLLHGMCDCKLSIMLFIFMSPCRIKRVLTVYYKQYCINSGIDIQSFQLAHQRGDSYTVHESLCKQHVSWSWKLLTELNAEQFTASIAAHHTFVSCDPAAHRERSLHWRTPPTDEKSDLLFVSRQHRDSDLAKHAYTKHIDEIYMFIRYNTP